MRVQTLSMVAVIMLGSGCAPPVVQNPKPVLGPVAEFDPTASPPVVPTPTDLALGPNHHPVIPPTPGATPAQVELNAYIESLDGFPPESTATGSFSLPLLPSSVTPSAVQVVDLSTTMPTGVSNVTIAASANAESVTVSPNAGWPLGHTIAVAFFGGEDPAGLKGPNGTIVIASNFTFLIRGERALLQKCTDLSNPACQCPFVAGQPFDPSCQSSVTGLTQAQAEAVEEQRVAFEPAVDAVLTISGRSRSNLVLIWTFTIAEGPFAVFDPTTSTLAFPNDVLINPTTGLVNLPTSPSMSAAQMQQIMGLNTLDGFSTTAQALVPINQSDANGGAAPGKVKAGTTAFLLNATAPTAVPPITAAPQLVGTANTFTGQIAITPVRPLLPDKTEYIGILTNGIVDSQNRPLQPSTLEALVQGPAPLFDPTTMQSTVSVLTNAQAQQLEALRQALAPILNQVALTGLTRADIAMIWTYRTQSMTAALRALDAYPAAKMLPTDVTILDIEPSGGALGADVGDLVFGTMHTHVALNATGTLDLTGGTNVDIPFLMAIPVTVPAGGAPVTVLQHGLGGWRGDMRGAAEGFNKAGHALIAIDINFHGARTICTADSDCANSGTCSATGQCSTSLLVLCASNGDCANNGTCSAAGQCSTSLAANSSVCMTHVEMGMPVTQCKPAASGKAFLNFANPFALRDNLRQHVLDLSQLLRVIADTGMTGLTDQLAAETPAIVLDAPNISYTGVSLGGIEGGLFLAVSPQPPVGVLNVPGGDLVPLFVTSPTFGPDIVPVAQAFGVMEGTAAFAQLLNTFQWIIDPGDPINFGRNIVTQPFPGNAPKKVIVQEAGMDQVILNEWTNALTTEIGLPFSGGHPAITAVLASNPAAGPQLVSTFFPTATHGFLLGDDPNLANTASGQLQAATWVASEGTLITTP